MNLVRRIRYGVALARWKMEGLDLIVEPVPGNSAREQQILLYESAAKDFWLARKPKPEQFGLRPARLFT